MLLWLKTMDPVGSQGEKRSHNKEQSVGSRVATLTPRPAVSVAVHAGACGTTAERDATVGVSSP